MRLFLAGLGSLVLLSSAPAQFTAPTFLAVRVNTTTNAVVIRNSPMATPSAFGTDIAVPDIGSGALTIANASTSEGALTVSANGRYVGFAGYRTGTSGTGTDRVIARLDVTTGVLNTSTAIPNGEAYSGASIRSAVWNDAGTQYWTSGTGTGGGTRTGTFTSTSGSVQVSTSVTNTRVLGIVGGQLYTTAASGANVGFNQVGTGLPTTTGNTTTLLANTGTSGTGTPSPYGFSLAANGLTLYMADDRTIANGGGIQKWTRADTASPFALATTFGTGTGSTVGARGLAVDFSGANPTVYAATAEGSANRLISFIDAGGVAGSFFTIDTAVAGTIYRGVAFTPVPEPATLLGVAAGVLGLARAVRRKTRRPIPIT